MQVPASTLDGLESQEQDTFGFRARLVFLAVLALVLVAGLVGFLGVRTSTAGASEDGWSLSFEYASIARPGLDVPWTATVRHEGGFGDQVTLALTGDYLDIYETQGFHPEPSATRRDATTLYLTFDAPADADTMVVTYDAYLQPAAQRGSSGTLAVLSDGERFAAVDFRTRVLP